MKRTRLFRSVKNGSSAAPAESAEIGSTMEPEVATKTKSKLCFENLVQNRINVKKPLTTNVKKAKKIRATVDLDMMKEELKQLEDPPVTEQEQKACAKRLQLPFFDVPCTDLAQKLLGKILVRRLENGTILRGRIVETEAYIGEIDKASQSYQLRVTPGNLPMYMAPGTIYVYLTYGMYHCFNISSAGKGAAVLLRGVEPLEGADEMRVYRSSGPKLKKAATKPTKKTLANHELCNGPSKLCIAFEIDKSLCKYSMCSCKSLWIENEAKSEDIKIVRCSRIGIDSAGPEWANKPLRYYIYGNTSVSKRDVKAEAELLSDDLS